MTSRIQSLRAKFCNERMNPPLEQVSDHSASARASDINSWRQLEATDAWVVVDVWKEQYAKASRELRGIDPVLRDRAARRSANAYCEALLKGD